MDINKCPVCRKRLNDTGECSNCDINAYISYIAHLEQKIDGMEKTIIYWNAQAATATKISDKSFREGVMFGRRQECERITKSLKRTLRTCEKVIDSKGNNH